MKKPSAMIGSVFALAMAGLLASSPSRAIELKVADSFPAGHFLVRLLLKPWMDDVIKRTNGAVTFNYFPSQQMGKAADMLRLTQAGVVDIAYIAPAYISDKLPLSEVATLPESFRSSCQGTRAYWKSARDGLLARHEYEPNKIRLMFVVTLPPELVFTVKRTIEKPEDFQGLKLRSSGGAQDLMLRSLGAIPVRMSAPDSYESLARGTMDGLIFTMESIESYGLDKLVKHSTDSVTFGSFVIAYSMNQAVWNKLPDEVKKAIDEASEATVAKACADIEAEQPASHKSLERAGLSFDPISEDATLKIKARLAEVAKEWAAALDSRGKPASAVLTEYESLLAASPAN
jgi:TRAP-type C4-dicarboxylate transport system substrate-binding protein